MDAPVQAIKSMKLYDQVERIHNELRALGIDEEAPLAVEDLTPFDQYHYHGTAACDAAIAALGLTARSRVLEVGAGIGGPARYIAHATGCHVTALELQPDLNATAEALSGRCRIAGDLRHLRGDMLQGPLRGQDFDAITSLLCFLHIPDRPALFTECFAALRPGGKICIEDFTKLAEPSETQWADLKSKVFCSYIPTPETYCRQLREAGFEAVELTDLTGSWSAFVQGRYAAFQQDRARQIEVNGPEVTAGLEEFFRVVADLYATGVTGGARIVATRPA